MNTMTAAPKSPPAAVTRSVLRSLLAIGLSAIVLTIALSVFTFGVIAVMVALFAPLLILLGAMIGSVAAIAAILKACTGERRVGAAVVVVVAAFVAAGLALLNIGSIPMFWVPIGSGGFDLVPMLIAVPSALILGLFLGQWWLRGVGVVGVVALIAGTVWLWPQPEASLESILQQEREARFEDYIDAHVYPMVADLPGGKIAGMVPGNPFHSLILTADGGVVEISRVPYQEPKNPEAYPCAYISEPNVDRPETDTLQDYAAWCTYNDDVWRRVDGTGYARLQGDKIIVVREATDLSAQIAGGDRPANAAEVRAAWASLRSMTEAEVREYVRDVWP